MCLDKQKPSETGQISEHSLCDITHKKTFHKYLILAANIVTHFILRGVLTRRVSLAHRSASPARFRWRRFTHFSLQALLQQSYELKIERCGGARGGEWGGQRGNEGGGWGGERGHVLKSLAKTSRSSLCLHDLVEPGDAEKHRFIYKSPCLG